MDSVEIPDGQAFVPGNKIKVVLHVSNSGPGAYSGTPTINATLGTLDLPQIQHSIFIGPDNDAKVPLTFNGSNCLNTTCDQYPDSTSDFRATLY
ncbi:MAG TPA: hypothetical protein VHR66_30245 [Gemmataceae bacterium]|nr:hypothetical protein [Gemmataceae bacterium]